MTEDDLGEPLGVEELDEAAAKLVAEGDIEALDLSALVRALTIGTYVADRCLVELERRGELEISTDGTPILPYNSDHMVVETMLTRHH